MDKDKQMVFTIGAELSKTSMKPALPVFQLFPPDSTTDLNDLQSYLLSCPGYAENAYNHGKSHEHLHLLGHLDRTESAIRIFVSGGVNNLTPVRAEVQAFFDCWPDAAPRMTAFALDSVLAFLIEGQYFEIIPRLNIVRRQLQRRYGVVPTGELERLTTPTS